MAIAIVVIVAWGALAFGAVYPWAYRPLLAACVAAGLVGLVQSRRRGAPVSRPAMLTAVLLVGGVVLQLVPLPISVLKAASPSTDAFLRSYDLGYALGVTHHPLSIDPSATAAGLLFLLVFMIFLAGLTRELARSGTRRLTSWIVGFGVVLALIGIVQKAMFGDALGMKIYGFWTPEHPLVTPFGPFVNKNHFAGWMLMAVPLALGVMLGAAERGRRHVQGGGWRAVALWFSSPDGGRFQLFALALLIMSASLLLTKSRSGLGGLVLSMALVAMIAARRFGAGKARWMTLGALALLVVVVFAMAGGDVAARIINRPDEMQLRKSIWTDSLAVIRDFPVTGTGLNTFGTAMVGYQTSHRNSDRGLHFQEAHNDYLQLLVEGGALLTIPILAALALALAGIRRRFASRQDDTIGYWTRVGATVGLAAVAAQSMFEFSLQMPGNAALAVVLLAIALHRAPARRSVPSSSHQPSQ